MTEGGRIIFMMPLKISNSAGSALMMRPAHSFFCETGAIWVAACMNFLQMRRSGDFAAMLILGKVGIRFYFRDLFGVAFAMRCNEQQPLVWIELLANRTVGHVRSQVRR